MHAASTAATSPALDEAIETMRDTDQDLEVEYDETSRGNCAVNVIEC